jgi:hypothetical protein
MARPEVKKGAERLPPAEGQRREAQHPPTPDRLQSPVPPRSGDGAADAGCRVKTRATWPKRRVFPGVLLRLRSSHGRGSWPGTGQSAVPARTPTACDRSYSPEARAATATEIPRAVHPAPRSLGLILSPGRARAGPGRQ